MSFLDLTSSPSYITNQAAYISFCVWMKSDPYPFSMWMKNDSHPLAE